MLLFNLCLFLHIFLGSPQDSILGTWHGTSLCVDKKTDVNCHDEVVIYVFDTVGVKTKGNVMWHAYKIVNNEKDLMGEFEIAYDSKADIWWSDYVPRLRGGKIRFRLKIDGDEMHGTLAELPSERLIRKMEVKRGG